MPVKPEADVFGFYLNKHLRCHGESIDLSRGGHKSTSFFIHVAQPVTKRGDVQQVLALLVCPARPSLPGRIRVESFPPVMLLSVGDKIGPYEIGAALGAGGMGEVYRAHDSKLARDIALKVLPKNFANDSDRMARFEREARVLASLNHPNIGAIYGLEESNGVRALIMELVEGPSLEQRMAKGPLQVAEALDVARQLAAALDYAHEKGVVHRDLKPANVKLTPDGQVKVLDFGLAKAFSADAVSGDPASSPTMTMHPGTLAGMILGTAAYMAPEQARGCLIDKRADVWAFGVVLFEMLTGPRLFEGESISDTLAAVLTKEPEWSKLPAAMPIAMRRLIQRCLVKDRKRRLRDIGDAFFEEGDDEKPGAPRTRRWVPVVLAGFLGAALLS